MEFKKHKRKKYFAQRISVLLQFTILPSILILDLFIEIYHHIGFPLCDMPRVKRSDYIKIDRHKLKYLTFGEKIGCVYCGYANGFARYITEIASRTEKYWCGIKHEKSKALKNQPHQKKFIEFNDEKEYEKFSRKKSKRK